MARFDVYEIKAQAGVPLVVDVQADLLKTLRTRVVVPLLPLVDAELEVAARLKPVIDIIGEPYVLMTTDLSTILSSVLGGKVTSVEQERQIIVDALDFLFQGF